MNDAVSTAVSANAANVTIGDEAITVDAAEIAKGLGVEACAVPGLMRQGEITGLCERGLDTDAGRHRLTFFYKSRRLRLIVDDEGRIVSRSAIDFGTHPLPERLRRTGA